jgi:hypothetical protein
MCLSSSVAFLSSALRIARNPARRALARAARVSPETSMYLSLQGKKEGAGAVAGAGAPVVRVCVKVAGGGKCAKAAGATCPTGSAGALHGHLQLSTVRAYWSRRGGDLGAKRCSSARGAPHAARLLRLASMAGAIDSFSRSSAWCCIISSSSSAFNSALSSAFSAADAAAEALLAAREALDGILWLATRGRLPVSHQKPAQIQVIGADALGRSSPPDFYLAARGRCGGAARGVPK